MKFVYNISQKRITSPENSQSAVQLAAKILSLFPEDCGEYPVYAVSFDKENNIMYKACADKKHEKLSVVTAHPENTECIFELLAAECPEISGSANSSNEGITLSRGAIRAALKRIYSKKSAVISVPDTCAENPLIFENIAGQIYRYLDIGTALKIVFGVNFMPAKDEKEGVYILPEGKIPPESESFKYNLAFSVNGETELDTFVDYLIDSEIESRRALLSVISKYKDYVEDQKTPREIQIYKAFVEGDEKLLFDTVHSYCVECSKEGKTPIIEEGVKALLAQNIRERTILKLIYEGYENCSFEELLTKNAAETAFCSSFREVGDLFSGDNAESYSISLASFLTNKAENEEKYDRYSLIDNEIKKTDRLFLKAENPIEFSMIGAYRRVLVTLLKRAEDIVGEIEEPSEDKKDVEAPANAGDEVETDKDISFVEKVKSLSLMTRDNYLDMYYNLFGSDYLNDLMGLEEESEDEGLLRELYTDRLLAIFRSYEDYKRAINECDRLKENPPLRLLAKIKYTETMCIALENSDSDGIAGVISEFDPEKDDPFAFYSLFYRRLIKIAEDEGSCEFMSALERVCKDQKLSALILAARVKASDSLDPEQRKRDIDKLVSCFELVKEYIGSDIIFDFCEGGEKYFGISLENYISAVRGNNTQKVREAAEKSADFNNFLAIMGVSGYEIKKSLITLKDNNYENEEKKEKPLKKDYDVIFIDSSQKKQGESKKDARITAEIVKSRGERRQLPENEEQKTPAKEPAKTTSKESLQEEQNENIGMTISTSGFSNDGHPELMKIGIAALSVLTALAIILFIIFLNG